MSESYLKVSADVEDKLNLIESEITAALGLVDDGMKGSFADARLPTILEDMQRQYGGDKEHAAYRWMERNFDVLVSMQFAAYTLLQNALNTIQLLPTNTGERPYRIQMMEGKEHG